MIIKVRKLVEKTWKLKYFQCFALDPTSVVALKFSFKGYLRYKAIASQNVLPEAQTKNLFIS